VDFFRWGWRRRRRSDHLCRSSRLRSRFRLRCRYGNRFFGRIRLACLGRLRGLGRFLDLIRNRSRDRRCGGCVRVRSRGIGRRRSHRRNFALGLHVPDQPNSGSDQEQRDSQPDGDPETRSLLSHPGEFHLRGIEEGGLLLGRTRRTNGRGMGGSVLEPVGRGTRVRQPPGRRSRGQGRCGRGGRRERRRAGARGGAW